MIKAHLYLKIEIFCNGYSPKSMSAGAITTTTLELIERRNQAGRPP
jgi:hypothetical protein